MEIWSFVEKKLKVIIPSYIKNVLMYCGYDNFHTISTIDENDLEYFTSEVRNGGIVNYFHNEFGTENALQGTNKSEQNFEFSRGHQKLIEAIVKLVKNTFDENGADAFPRELPKSKSKNSTEAKTEAKKTVSARPNYFINMSASTLKESEQHSKCIQAQSKAQSKSFFYENLIDLQADLLKKTLQSLLLYSVDMYEKNMELIGTKISNDLVYITYENTKRCYSAMIKCPYCGESIPLSNISNEWDISNFHSHLKVHSRDDGKLERFEKSERFDIGIDTILNNETEVSESLASSHILPPVLAHQFNIDQKEDACVDSAKTNDNDVITLTSTEIDEAKAKSEDSVIVKEGDYVICSFTKESSVKWPSCVPTGTHLLGQILHANKNIELQVLTRFKHSKFIFTLTNDKEVVLIENILKVLEVPTPNRRKKLVFNDFNL